MRKQCRKSLSHRLEELIDLEQGTCIQRSGRGEGRVQGNLSRDLLLGAPVGAESLRHQEHRV